MAKTNSQIENARFAMQFLQSDIIHAGYWGAYIPVYDDFSIDVSIVPNDAPGLIPDPCLAYTTPWSTTSGGYIDSLLGIPIQVYSATPGTCSTSTVVADKLANTDVLVVRHAATCIAGETNCEADSAGNLYFQVSNCTLELDDSMNYSLATSGFSIHERDCVGSAGSPPTITAGTVAGKRKFVQTIYYIRDYAVTAGDGIPTLVRSEFDLNSGTLAHQQAVELVRGIERFRVELAFDNESDTGANVNYSAAIDWADVDNRDSPTNRGDGVPEGVFIHCPSASPTCTAAQLTNTVAVKIYILARADQPSPGYTDTKTYTLGGLNVAAFGDDFKRHVFSTSMRIHNIATRRETP